MLLPTDEADRLSKKLENVDKPVFQPWNKRIRNYTSQFLVNIICVLIYWLICINFWLFILD